MKKTLLLLTAALSLGTSPALAWDMTHVPEGTYGGRVPMEEGSFWKQYAQSQNEASKPSPAPSAKSSEDRWHSAAGNIVVVGRDGWGKPNEIRGDARVTERDAQGRAIAAEINGVRKVCVVRSAGCSNQLEGDVDRSMKWALVEARQDWETNTPQGRAFRQDRILAHARYEHKRDLAISRCTAAGLWKHHEVAACVQAQGYR